MSTKNQHLVCTWTAVGHFDDAYIRKYFVSTRLLHLCLIQANFSALFQESIQSDPLPYLFFILKEGQAVLLFHFDAVLADTFTELVIQKLSLCENSKSSS